MDINEKLVHGLLDINHMMRMLYEGKASQSRILIILYEQKVMTQKDLTEFLGIKPGSVSAIFIPSDELFWKRFSCDAGDK